MNTTTLSTKHIAIIGGGPGGLTLARLLQQKGASVKVYERDTDRNTRVQGATLDLHDESGLKALRAAGLMEAFEASYRPGADKVRVLDEHAKIAMDEFTSGQNEHGEPDPAYFRPEIDRGPLRDILLNSLQPATVIWNSHFKSMAPDKNYSNGWQIVFHNGQTASADIVIGADGANSKVRPWLTDIKPTFAGITTIEGAVYDSATATPHMHEILGGGKIFALGSEQSLIVSSKGDGSLVFYMGWKTSETWWADSGIDFSNKTQVTDWFKREFNTWDKAWLELFENAEPKFIVRPLYCYPLDQHWQSKTNLTLIGDAAHLMPPYAGEGVNMAMLDALELADALTSEDSQTPQTAIARYEQSMLTRFAQIGALTLQQTAVLHAPGALEYLIRLFTEPNQQ